MRAVMMVRLPIVILPRLLIAGRRGCILMRPATGIVLASSALTVAAGISRVLPESDAALMLRRNWAAGLILTTARDSRFLRP